MSSLTRGTLKAAALGLLGASLLSCAALEDYSRRRAEMVCASLPTCTVYDQTGIHQSPCWSTPGEGPIIYPGDLDWPFSPGVCPGDGSDSRSAER